ncbi:hypothetical protein COU76_01280 [Candidatus Peregrinibacteria bacterium CG10_big_fil_rev_8_21_14_0_10_49_10]|nr:MAG: hypothetical protein COU76_01280 [Candidatus Peregrinibacteria bacterium CG10_big_fil_rev_8_21_14_0_10_49_10]
MVKSENTVTLATIRSKRNTVEDKISRLNKDIESLKKELEHFDWLEQNFFDEHGKKTAKEFAEEALLQSEKPMKPKELYEAMKQGGYQGKFQNLYMYLYKWNKRKDPIIFRVGEGLYSHRSSIQNQS